MMTNKIALLLLLCLLLNSFDFTCALKYFPERKKRKKRERDGFRKTSEVERRGRGFADKKQVKWLRLDLPPDSMLRIGITRRPKDCPIKSQSGDYLSVHYNGTLFSDSSKVFDSSILREEPLVFQIGRKLMIEGWEKGLLNMCVGEKRKLAVPSDLAYGSVGGFGGESINSIYPNATLVYNVELLSILDEDEAAPYLVWNLPY